MFERLSIPNAYFSQQWLDGRPLVANAYLFTRETGNVLMDPISLDESTHGQLERLGGVSLIVVLTPDRQSEAQSLAARYKATFLANPSHRQCFGGDMLAIHLPDQDREHAFAVSLPGDRAVVVGESLVGSPAGGLSMNVLGDDVESRRAALGLRRILRENPERLLVASGHPIFSDAYAVLFRLLYERAGAELLRINVDELEFLGEDEDQPAQYRCLDAEVGFAIGARKLGYRVSTLAPGQRFCPLHGHAREEEMFFVLDGAPSIRTLSGTIRCRKGDFIAFPVGDSGTHQLLNESDAPATVLLLARTEAFEACYYPDSNKLLVDTNAPLEGRTSFMLRAGPQLDYFDGET